MNSEKTQAPFLVRAMLFNTSGWERRRNVGQQRFVAGMTTFGAGAGAILVGSTVFSAWRAGDLFQGLLSGSNLVLLVSGLMMPLVLFSVAGLEWRLLEARYKLELERQGRAPSRVPGDPLPHAAAIT